MSLGSSPMMPCGDFLGVGVLGGAAGALGVAEADAGVPQFGGDLGEEENHLRHGLLPAREDLGVADGNGEGEAGGGQFDVPDQIDGAHGFSFGRGLLRPPS
jgi:hypothetical protein